MTHKAITLKFVVPTVLAIVLGILLAFGVDYLGHHHGPVDQSEARHFVAGNRGIAELPTPDARLSRVHLLLSNTK